MKSIEIIEMKALEYTARINGTNIKDLINNYKYTKTAEEMFEYIFMDHDDNKTDIIDIMKNTTADDLKGHKNLLNKLIYDHPYVNVTPYGFVFI